VRLNSGEMIVHVTAYTTSPLPVQQHFLANGTFRTGRVRILGAAALGVLLIARPERNPA
jgi:hypothetical protein